MHLFAKFKKAGSLLLAASLAAGTINAAALSSGAATIELFAADTELTYASINNVQVEAMSSGEITSTARDKSFGLNSTSDIEKKYELYIPGAMDKDITFDFSRNIVRYEIKYKGEEDKTIKQVDVNNNKITIPTASLKNYCTITFYNSNVDAKVADKIAEVLVFTNALTGVYVSNADTVGSDGVKVTYNENEKTPIVCTLTSSGFKGSFEPRNDINIDRDGAKTALLYVDTSVDKTKSSFTVSIDKGSKRLYEIKIYKNGILQEKTSFNEKGKDGKIIDENTYKIPLDTAGLYEVYVDFEPQTLKNLNFDGTELEVKIPANDHANNKDGKVMVETYDTDEVVTTTHGIYYAGSLAGGKNATFTFNVPVKSYKVVKYSDSNHQVAINSKMDSKDVTVNIGENSIIYFYADEGTKGEPIAAVSVVESARTDVTVDTTTIPKDKDGKNTTSDGISVSFNSSINPGNSGSKYDYPNKKEGNPSFHTEFMDINTDGTSETMVVTLDPDTGRDADIVIKADGVDAVGGNKGKDEKPEDYNKRINDYLKNGTAYYTSNDGVYTIPLTKPATYTADVSFKYKSDNADVEDIYVVFSDGAKILADFQQTINITDNYGKETGDKVDRWVVEVPAAYDIETYDTDFDLDIKTVDEDATCKITSSDGYDNELESNTVKFTVTPASEIKDNSKGYELVITKSEKASSDTSIKKIEVTYSDGTSPVNKDDTKEATTSDGKTYNVVYPVATTMSDGFFTLNVTLNHPVAEVTTLDLNADNDDDKILVYDITVTAKDGTEVEYTLIISTTSKEEASYTEIEAE